MRLDGPVAVSLILLLGATGCGGSPSAPTPAPAASAFREFASEHFTIHHTAIDASSVAQTAASLERDYARITSDLGVRTTPRVHVFLYATRDALQAAVRSSVGELPSFATGLVTGADTIHILSPTLGAIWPYEVGVRNMTHEFAHCVTLVVNGRIGNNPRWLWESVAIYEAGQFVDPRSLTYLAGGASPSLESLDGFDNTRIYDLGYLIAEFIVTRWGRDTLIALVASNGDLAGVTGLASAEFMSAWRDFARTRYGV